MKAHIANSNTWSDGNEYIMNTASEVHTNALFDIYPNDTTITAEFKGNTQQNGTPSPSAPVPVVGVGYLDGAAYKIPVEIGLSTQSIDLSAVQSVRNIKKYIFTGEEEIRGYDSTYHRVFVNVPNVISFGTRLTPVMCTHYIPIFDGRPITDVPNNSISSGIITDYGFYFYETDYTTINDFKDFLQNQYLNGTPVIIYFALAAPVTDTINEPLQKIGDYADSISNITLTTTAGAKSFGVDTAVKPSEITLNFKGWHPKDPKESSGGEWG